VVAVSACGWSTCSRASPGSLTAGKTAEDYLADEGLREMIERNIARISEAAPFVPNEVRTRYPAIPWRRIVGIGT
jgi:uncharacterized protein with HEPN domain